MARAHVILFEHAQFHGQHKHVFDKEPNLNADDDHYFNDKVSSLVVLEGNWAFYADSGFQRPYPPILGPGLYPVLPAGITNDDMSSLQKVDATPTVSGDPVDSHVMLFEHANANFHGAHKHVFTQEPNLNAADDHDFNKKVESLVVLEGNWAFYPDPNFQGQYPPILGPGLYPVLPPGITNDDMSSLQAVDATSTVSGDPVDSHVVLFEHVSFHGLHKHVFTNEPNLNANDDFNEKVSSFVILSGYWVFFSDPNFQNPYPYEPYGGAEFGPAVDGTWVEALGIKNDRMPSLYPVHWRTLFVVQFLPEGADHGIFFSTITDALNQAAMMAPSSTNHIGIVVFPGIYTEDIMEIVSNVSVVQAVRGTAQLAGNATWMPGLGINAPQLNDKEFLTWQIGFQDDTNLFTIDSTGKKNDSFVVFHMYQSQLQQIKATGRGQNPGVDNLFFEDVIFLTNANTFTDVTGALSGVELWHCRVRGTTFAGSTTARIDAGESAGRKPHTWTGTGTGIYTGIDIVFPISADAGTTVKITGEIDAALSGDGTFDVRGCNFGGNANLFDGTTMTGITGKCSRTTWTDSVTTAAGRNAGLNVVTILPAYPDNASYNVSLQLINGPGNAGATVINKQGVSFTINDTVGNNTFDYTIIQD
jgi:hypothetical protein